MSFPLETIPFSRVTPKCSIPTKFLKENKDNIHKQFMPMIRYNDGTLRPLPKETLNLLEELKKASVEGNKK